MKVLSGFLLAVELLTAGCDLEFGSDNRVVGSGVQSSEQREVEVFSAVETRIGVDVKIHRSSEPTLKITADDNLLPIITTEVRNGTLLVSSTNSFSTEGGVHLELGMPVLESIAIKGSGKFALDAVTDDRLEIDIAGSGRVDANGAVDQLIVVGKGSSRLKCRDLLTKKCSIEIKGSGNAEVSVEEFLQVEISGSGNVIYHGEPKVESSIKGSGNVTDAGKD